MVEVQNNLITLVFCQDLESPTICGRKLCWNSDEKVIVLDIDELILLYKQGKEDEDNFFDFDSISQKVPVKEQEHGKLSKVEPCTPAYILHLTPQANLTAEDDLVKC